MRYSTLTAYSKKLYLWEAKIIFKQSSNTVYMNILYLHFMNKIISQLDFSSASVVIKSNTVSQVFSSIKRNHLIILSAKDIQKITTGKPQHLQ